MTTKGRYDVPTQNNDTSYEDIIEVIKYLMWQEREYPNAMWGGKRISNVIDAFGRVVGFERDIMRSIANIPKEDE